MLILKETCEAIWNALHSTYLVLKRNWLRSVKASKSCGISQIVNGKYIVIQAPMNAGSTFYNYEGAHSVALLAVCDAEYCFNSLMAIAPYGAKLQFPK